MFHNMRFAPRQTKSGTDEFLDLIADPFQTEVQVNSIYAAIVYSFVVSGGLFLAFCLLRPRAPTVYAPRAKYADEKHAPLALDRNLFSWIKAIRGVKEQELVEKIGLDAVVFLRFQRMLRNIFLVLTVLGLGILLPVNFVGGHDVYDQWDNVATLMKFTPQYIFGTKFWAFVICSYLFQGTVCFFIWWNYKAVLRLRRSYFNSHDYQASLHSRTLLLRHIPEASRTDSGVAQLVGEAKQTEEVAKAAISRNVKDLPELIEKHEAAVIELEGYLAKYLKDPKNLPINRPTCKVSKEDRTKYGNVKVDAIGYWTERIARLEDEIHELRETVDRRNPMPFGFASYTHIEDAHAVAYAARKGGPGGSTITLAPKPHDLIWQNLPMSKATRRSRAIWDGLWVTVLTIVFIVPNILTSVFLSDFSHLGLLWPAFMTNLKAHPTGWGIAQGILAPLVQTLLYMAIPPIFRRLYTHSGDVSKTQRDRHVLSRLYAFFVFNNLFVFSLFGSAFKFVASVIAAQDKGVWQAIREGHLFSNVMIGVCNVSTFWFTWQMQRNLGAATDLMQLTTLLWGSFQRRFMSPSPRELIQLTAPQPFDYAGYYNNFLFVATVGFTFGTLQPLILPITAFYLGIEMWWKKYLLQYVFITKTESGGVFWKPTINRLLFGIVLGNAVIALVVGAQGVGSIDSVRNGNMLYAMIPLPFLLWAFKWYCVKSFDTKIAYFTTQGLSDLEDPSTGVTKKRRNERVGVRFGHPAMYKKLFTPMVHAKSQHLLNDVYRGRLESNHEHAAEGQRQRTPSNLGYSDMYLADLDHNQPGKADTSGAPLPFEAVSESEMDFEHFMRRAEFREEYGGDGELYGRPEDLISRPGTPSTFTTMTGTMRDAAVEMLGGSSPRQYSGHSTPRSPVSRSQTATPTRDFDGEAGTSHARGYQHVPLNDNDELVRSSTEDFRRFSRERLGSISIPDPDIATNEIIAAGGEDDEARTPLSGHGAGMGVKRKPLH